MLSARGLAAGPGLAGVSGPSLWTAGGPAQPLVTSHWRDEPLQR